MIPFIEGESGKEGWEAIKEEAANASEGKLINVTMNGASVVPGDVIDSMKGQDVTISFDMGSGISWLINGMNVTADHAGDVDLSVEVGTSDIPGDIVTDVAGDLQAIQLSLAHSGDFGYSAVLVINVGPDNAELYANLFYYDEAASGLTFITADQINEDGVAELNFTHASNYVIVIGDDIMGEIAAENSSGNNGESADGSHSKGTGAQSPEADESDVIVGGAAVAGLQPGEKHLNIIWFFLIGAVGLAAAGAITYLIHRKVNQSE